MKSFSSTLIEQNQLSLDDLIQAVGDAADTELFEAALRECETVCLLKETFSIDDIHFRLTNAGIHFENGSFLGAVMREAKKMGLCKPLQTFIPSERPERHHSPVRLWKSSSFPPSK